MMAFASYLSRRAVIIVIAFACTHLDVRVRSIAHAHGSFGSVGCRVVPDDCQLVRACGKIPFLSHTPSPAPLVSLSSPPQILLHTTTHVTHPPVALDHITLHRDQFASATPTPTRQWLIIIATPETCRSALLTLLPHQPLLLPTCSPRRSLFAPIHASQDSSTDRASAYRSPARPSLQIRDSKRPSSLRSVHLHLRRPP
jgi:hypothetical protein